MREAKPGLEWQSKAILLIVVPWTAISVLLQSYWWAREAPVVVWTTLGISAVFGLVVWRLRAGTLAAAATGAAITASLMYSTTRFPYATSWLHGGLLPLLAVFLLTFAATKIGKAKKEQIGTGESKRGRNAAQVAANLGVAALIASLEPMMAAKSVDKSFNIGALLAFAALAEAAADTVSSEIGQVFGGKPRMLTTFRSVESGTDGAITFAGTMAGALAAAAIAGVATLCLSSGWNSDTVGPGRGDQIFFFLLTTVAGVFGLLFDSLLGATFERKSWLNNDGVNFLSTLSAPIFVLLVVLAHSLLFPHILY